MWGYYRPVVIHSRALSKHHSAEKAATAEGRQGLANPGTRGGLGLTSESTDNLRTVAVQGTPTILLVFLTINDSCNYCSNYYKKVINITINNPHFLRPHHIPDPSLFYIFLFNPLNSPIDDCSPRLLTDEESQAQRDLETYSRSHS